MTSRVRDTPVTIAVVALAALVLAAAAHRVGALPVLALLGAAGAGALLLTRPAVAVAVVVVAVVVLEGDTASLLHAPPQLYGYLPGFQVTGVEALLGLAVAAVVLDAVVRGDVRAPEPFTLALALVTVAFATGAITGLAAGAGGASVFEALRRVVPLVVVPILVVNVVRTREDLGRWVAGGAALAIFKGGVGVAMIATGLGVEIDDETTGTYLESTANLLSVLFLAGVAAAALVRAPLPRWVWAGAPIVALSLVLSFRRSFWIAAVAALLLVLVIGSGRVGRRLLVPAIAVLGALGWLLVATGVGGQVDGPVAERAASLDPSKVRRNDQDRYRISERRNVLDEIERAPVTGLGLGRPWAARNPMPDEHPNGREYVHFAALFWWLKAGLLGLLAYLAVLGTGIVTAVRNFGRERDPALRAAALGAGAGLVGLALAELTATFTGSEVRATVLLAAVLGLLAAQRRLSVNCWTTRAAGFGEKSSCTRP